MMNAELETRISPPARSARHSHSSFSVQRSAFSIGFLMLLPAIPPFRRRRGRPGRNAPPAPPPPAALTLVEALYSDIPALIRLTFDRAIDITALDGSQITVDDGESFGTLYAATGAAVLVTPQAV